MCIVADKGFKQVSCCLRHVHIMCEQNGNGPYENNYCVIIYDNYVPAVPEDMSFNSIFRIYGRFIWLSKTILTIYFMTNFPMCFQFMREIHKLALFFYYFIFSFVWSLCTVWRNCAQQVR